MTEFFTTGRVAMRTAEAVGEEIGETSSAITALESDVDDLESADTSLDGRLDAAESTIVTHTSAISTNAGAVVTEASARGAADTTLGNRITALEAGTNAPGTLYQLAEIQIGTWVGVPLYRKVVAISAGPNQEGLQIAHGITGASAGHITRLQGYLRRSSDKLNVPLPYAHVDSTFAILLSIDLDDGDNIFLTTTAGNYSGFAGHVVVEYTKS